MSLTENGAADRTTATTEGRRFLSGSVARMEVTMTSRLVQFLVDNNLLIGRLVRALRTEGIIDARQAGRLQLMPDLTSTATCLLETLMTTPDPSLDSFFLNSDETFQSVYDAIKASMNESRRGAIRKLSECVREPRCHWSTFYRHLYDCHLAENVSTIRFEGGLTLLHLIVLYDRHDLLRSIQYLGIWSRLRMEVIPRRSEHEHRGKTPVELASVLERRDALEEIRAIDFQEDHMTELERHAQTGNEAAFREGLRVGGMDVGQSLLLYACQSGSLNMTMAVMEEERLRMFPRTSVEDEVKIAVRLGHAHLLKILSRYVDVNFASLKVDNKSLIEQTIAFGYWDVFDVLSKMEVPVPSCTIALAASNGHAVFTENVLKFHTSLNINYRDRRQKTALLFAVERGHVDVARMLLEHNADMLIPDCRGCNVMHSCAGNAATDMLDVLTSAARERLQLRSLLEKRSKYTGQERCFLVRGKEGSAPVWQYVEVDRGVISLFQARVRSGSVTVREFGTVLKSGRGRDPPPEVVSEMSKRCDVINVSADAADDMLPLHVAIFKETECALTLIERTPDVNQADCFGLTSLHLAAMRGNNKLVQALLARGANPRLTDLRGRTPAAIARLNHHGNVTGLPPDRPITNGQSRLQPMKHTDGQRQPFMGDARMTSSLRTSPNASRKAPKWRAMEDIPSYAKKARASLMVAYNDLDATRFQDIRRSGQDPEVHTRQTMRRLRDDVDRLLTSTSTDVHPLDPHR